MLLKNDANMSRIAIEKLNDICNGIEKDLNEFNLSGFRGISIVSDDLLGPDSDGRLENMMILLPKNKIEKYFIRNMDNIVKSTIYHELCHVDLANSLPKLHSLYSFFLEKEDFISAYTIMTYIEYVAHIKSYKYESCETRENYLRSFNNIQWNLNDETHKVYFIKSAPYVIARDQNKNFISSLSNIDLKKRLIEIEKELKKIVKIGMIDNYFILSNLENIVKKYISNDL